MSGYADASYAEVPYAGAAASGMASEASVAAAVFLDGTPLVAIRINGELAAAAAIGLDGTLPLKVAGTAFAVTAVDFDGTIPEPTTPIVLLGDPWVAAATMLDGTPLGAIRVNGDPFSAPAAVGLDGTGRLRLPGDPAPTVTTVLDGSILGQPVTVLGNPWTTTAVILDGVLLLVVATETANLGNGRSRSGSGEDRSIHPVPAAPAIPGSTGTLTKEPLRIMAQRLPAPVVVNGRPQ